MKPKAFIKEFRKEVKTLVITSFGFVTALAWNDAITSLIQKYIPTQSEWYFMLLKAIVITLIAVLVTLSLIKKENAPQESS